MTTYRIKNQTTIALVSCGVGALLCLAFGLVAWVDGNLLLATVNVAMGLVFVVVGMWIRLSPRQNVPVSLLFIAGCLFFFFLFVTGGAYSTGMLWGVMVPLFGFFLLSFWHGVLVSTGYLLLVTTTFLLNQTSVIDLTMISGQVFLRFFAIYVTVGSVVAFYERTRAKYEAQLLHKVNEHQELEMELSKLKRAIDQSSSVILITDTQGTIEYANARIEETSGYALEEIIGSNPRIFKSGETDPAVHNELWNTISTGGTWYGELRNKRKDGSLFWEATSISPIRDGDGNITHYLSVKEDVTWRKSVDENLAEMYRETQRMNQVMSGREDRVIELKNEVNALSRKLGQETVYPSVEGDS